MNSNVEEYLSTVNAATAQALVSGKTSLSAILPCLLCRELEVPNNRFVDSSDPFMVSYRALRRMHHFPKPSIPRKIEFGSAVYLKEGIIDCIFPGAPVTLIFVGDGNSDKRFAYNSYRLFNTLPKPFPTHCFIYNPELKGSMFGDQTVTNGWDKDHLFYHAESWNELNVLIELIQESYSNSPLLLIIDLDGTLLCPRPNNNANIKTARRKAIVSLSDKFFDNSFFSAKSAEQVAALESSYGIAGKTGFSKAYDDEDLTMLIALGLYAGIITDRDPLLNPLHNVGFVTPIEWLQYAAFLIESDTATNLRLRRLRSLYVRCMDAIQTGSPTAFVDFRKEEEKILVRAAKTGEITLSRAVIDFLNKATGLQGIPLGFSDRPNASLGLATTSSPAFTMTAGADSLFHTPLVLA